MKTLIIVPTYNEAPNVRQLLDAILSQQPSLDILVVDDGSPDGTADIVAQYIQDDLRVHLLRRAEKLGLGVAYQAGFAWALRRSYEFIGQMDADGSHQPADLARLLDASRNADLVIGSRWVDGGGVRNWPWYRTAISRGGTWYAQRLLGLQVRDITAGFRIFNRRTLQQLTVSGIASQGYCFQIDMAQRAADLGCAVVEVPITFVEREYGRSKMSSAIVIEALWRVTGWGIARLWTSLGRGSAARFKRYSRADR